MAPTHSRIFFNNRDNAQSITVAQLYRFQEMRVGFHRQFKKLLFQLLQFLAVILRIHGIVFGNKANKFFVICYRQVHQMIISHQLLRMINSIVQR